MVCNFILLVSLFGMLMNLYLLKSDNRYHIFMYFFILLFCSHIRSYIGELFQLLSYQDGYTNASYT